MFYLWPPSNGLALKPGDLRPLSTEELREREYQFWLGLRPGTPEQIAEHARMCQNFVPPTDTVA